MPTFTWGSTGSIGSLKTSEPGNGWYTDNLPLPDVRIAYNSKRYIHIRSVEAIFGSGSRQYYYAVGRSGWVYTGDGDGGTYEIFDNSIFDFRVAKAPGGGVATIGWRKNDDYVTRWIDGDFVGNGVQPGRMVYYEVPSAPGTRIVPSTTVQGEVAIVITEPTDDGGTPILLYRHQIATDEGFTKVIAEWTSAGSTSRSGLPTRRTLFTRTFAVNLVTNNAGIKGGTASTPRSFSLGTPVVTAPGINAASNTSGRSTVVTLTPPTNTGGLPITEYETQVQYLSPSPIPNPSTRTLKHKGVTLNVTGQKPGASYRYRSRAYNVMGSGPYSGWITVAQSQPSFNAGDYFDGSNAAESDTTYSWAGTVNNSASIATSPGLLGWQTSSGTDVVIAQASGGLTGNGTTKGVRVIFKADQTSVVRVGQRNDATWRSAVLPGQKYSGSGRVRLARSQRMVAEIAWLDSGGSLIEYAVGDEVVVPANEIFTLSVEAASPDTAAFGIIRLRDETGSGHSYWRSGETYTQDAMMLSFGGPYPYFDGSFAPSGNYVYEWSGTPNQSVSARHTVETFVNPLVDPDCAIVPAAPRPPVVPNYCIEEVGVWRRLWWQIDQDSVMEYFDTIPTLYLRSGFADERQVRIRYYATPFARAIEEIDPEDYCAEQIISYLPANTALTIDGISQSAWAQVAGSRTLDANHLLYGADGMPPSWPVLECGLSYFITLDVPPENDPGNVTLDFDLVPRY